MCGEQGRLPAADDVSAEFRSKSEGNKGTGYIPRETVALTKPVRVEKSMESGDAG